MSFHDSLAQEQIEGHNRRNQELRKTLAGYGVDMDKDRVCDLHFKPPDESSTRQLATALADDGCQLRVREPFEFGLTKYGWGLEVQKTISPNALMDAEFTTRMVLLACRFNAVFDGWGTSVHEAA